VIQRTRLPGGFTCPRSVKDVERTRSNRVLHPYIRVGSKPGRKDLRKASWDKALDLVADMLKRTLREYGADTVLHLEYAGNMGLLTWYFPQRLWNALGATGTDYSICSRSLPEAFP